MITAEVLRELFRYNPETGEFTRLPRRDVRPCWNSRYVGKPVGTVSATTGYLVININKKMYAAHRLAWLYVYGEFPEKHLDHKNNNRVDNRIENLREASDTENRANQRVRCDSKTGVKGATFHKGAGRYRARIRQFGKETHLGLFDTIEEAHAAYCAEAARVFGEFARYE